MTVFSNSIYCRAYSIAIYSTVSVRLLLTRSPRLNHEEFLKQHEMRVKKRGKATGRECEEGEECEEGPADDEVELHLPPELVEKNEYQNVCSSFYFHFSKNPI